MPPLPLKTSWSHSRLNAFETCPRRYYLTTVTKKVFEPQNEASSWGNKVHSALERYAGKSKPLPSEMQPYGKYVDAILAHEGKHIIEAKLTLDSSFRPTTWTAKNAWLRGIIDIGVIGDNTALLVDWKTGKRKVDPDQLKLFAAIAFAHYPWIDKVTTAFVWLKTRDFDKEVFTRDQTTELWDAFLPRLQRFEIAHAEQKWPAQPSGLCKNYCPVGRTNCEHCGV